MAARGRGYNRHMRHLTVPLLLLAGALAADAQAPRPSPNGFPNPLQRAIDRLAKADLSKKAVIGPTFLDKSPPGGSVCSVPLLEMKVEHPERYTMRKVTPPGTEDRMPVGRFPASACEPELPAHR